MTSDERQRGVRVQIRRRDDAGAEPPQAGGGNHRRIVGRQRQARHECRNLARVAAGAQLLAQAGCWPTRRRRCRCWRAWNRRAASNVRSISALTTTRWKLAQISAISASESVSGRPASALVTCRSTAVFRPLKLKSRSPLRCGAFRSACVSRVVGSAIARSLPLRGQPVDDRPAGIAEAEQLGDLVVRLARRIVARPADELVAGRRARTRYRLVWPPDTTSTTAGSGSSPLWSTSDSMWPAR